MPDTDATRDPVIDLAARISVMPEFAAVESPLILRVVSAAMREVADGKVKHYGITDAMEDALNSLWSLLTYRESWEYPGQVTAHIRKLIRELESRSKIQNVLDRCAKAQVSMSLHFEECSGMYWYEVSSPSPSENFVGREHSFDIATEAVLEHLDTIGKGATEVPLGNR